MKSATETQTATRAESAPVTAPAPATAPATALISPSSSVTPVRVTLVIGSNRVGRFGPVVAEWLLGRVRGHEDFEVEVVDVAEADLPTTFAPTPQATARLAEITPKLAAAEVMLDQLAWWGRALREAKERRPYGG